MSPISLRLKSKRAQLALRFFTYGVMTLATVVLTTLAIFYAMGFRFNNETNQFDQGGLIQFRSTPPGANVLVDGKQQTIKTPDRLNLAAGTHDVTMRLNGYREWKRTVSLAPGQLLWLNYTRLIPESITTTPLRTFPSVAKVMTSPDHRWMLVQQKQDVPAFTLVDVNDEKNPAYTDFTLPETAIRKADNKYGQFTIVEWDLSSRFILIHHQNGTVNEWLRIERSKPQEAINLSQVFGLDIGEAHFAGSNPNLVYAKTNDVLRRLDLGANSASAALVNGLVTFSVYGDDTISFVAHRQGAPNEKQEVIGLFRQDKETVIQAYPAGTSLKVAYSEYDHHGYLTIHKNDGAIQVLRDPGANTKDTSQFVSITVSQPLSWLMFSNNGRMVVGGTDTSMTTYDIELDKTFQASLGFMGGANLGKPQWLDDYSLWTDTGGRLRIFEYDGLNDREITTVGAGYGVNLSQSGKTLFSIGKNAITNTYFLQASKLVLE
ncbi:MAG TPA: PEGA domain-containing protein [Candidatus Saccharimonadales bacterium]|nr:PEGA domain-containing protein [Candidatus Saccharimonadales bacterium]